MKDATLNILIGGEAGQGLVTVGQLLSKCLVRSGYFIVVTQSYQSRIRGGHNTYAIRVGMDEVTAPKESVDLLIAFDGDTVNLHRHDLSPEGLIVVDTALGMDGERFLTVPYKEFGQERFTNVAALGVLCSLLGLDEGVAADTVDDFFGKKDKGLAAENRRALKAGANWTTTQNRSGCRLPAVPKPAQR